MILNLPSNIHKENKRFNKNSKENLKSLNLFYVEELFFDPNAAGG